MSLKILTLLRETADKYKRRVRLFSVGTSYEGRHLFAVEVRIFCQIRDKNMKPCHLAKRICEFLVIRMVNKMFQKQVKLFIVYQCRLGKSERKGSHGKYMHISCRIVFQFSFKARPFEIIDYWSICPREKIMMPFFIV